VTLLVLVVVVVGLAASMVLSVAQLATILPTYQAQFTQLSNELRAWLGSLGVGPQQLQEALGKINFGEPGRRAGRTAVQPRIATLAPQEHTPPTDCNLGT
jgi:hypothetical protein